MLFGASTAALAQASTAPKAPKARVVIVLDASGSMWGQVDGTPKIVIARNVIHDMMKTWDKAIDVGLIAYGHRSKGNCKDIETLVPVGPADPKAIDKAVDSLNPKGKTPLTAAVTRAAEDLKYTEEAATVILVSDGLETCHADPCAAAAALEKAGVNFTAHVIGFGLKENEQKKLRCLADKTGGLFLAAKDAPTLEASLGKAVKVAKEEAAKPPPPPPAPKIKGIHFKAFYAEGGEPLTSNTSWKVYTAAKDVNGKRKDAGYSYNSNPAFKLEPGQYVVTLEVGSAGTEKTFEVKAGEGQNIDVILNAGLAAVSAKRTADADKTIADGLSWRVYHAEANIEGKREQASYSYNSNPVFTLPAGNYRVTVSRGSASAEAEITVKPGARTESTLILNSGVLAAKALFADGGKPISGNTSWKVYRAEKNLEGKRESVTYSYNAQPGWELTAGKYLLTIERGSASAQKEVSVTANQRTETTIVLNAGLLAAKVTGSSPSWRVYTAQKDINGKRQSVTYSYNSAPVWTLTAGRYLVRVESHGKAAEREVEIKAGQRTEVSLEPK